MKPFSEFYSSLTTAHLEEWSREFNIKNRNIRLPLTDETLDEFMSYIISANVDFMLKILREYHEWLSRQ